MEDMYMNKLTIIESEDYIPVPEKETEKKSSSASIQGFSGVMTGQEEFPGKKILIKVCGVGGGGGNAIERMIEQGMEEVDFIVINTDAQALSRSSAPIKVQIGSGVTGGLGAGSIPERGASAAEEDREAIREVLQGAHMIFLTSGMGGGTGTGAAPIVAQIAKELGALTVAVVTLPFEFEGPIRREYAREGIQRLRQYVDALITIPNDRVATLKDLTVKEAFLKVDEVLHNGIRAITDLIKIPQMINIDFADIRTVLQNSGKAHLGIGFARGVNRSEEAVIQAIECNLLDTKSIRGAKGAILNVHGGSDMKMEEVLSAGRKLRELIGPEANVIFGAMIGDELREDICVTVIAAGFPEEQVEDEFIPRSITEIAKEQKTVGNGVSTVNKGNAPTSIPKEKEVEKNIIRIEKDRGGELFSKEELAKSKEIRKEGKPTLDPTPPWLRRFK